ncbi:endonuclease/exonuclease/phosphatase family protein [Rhodococcus koreensis]
MPDNNNPAPVVLDPRIFDLLAAANTAAEFRKSLTGLGTALAQLAWLGEPAGPAESPNQVGGRYRRFTNGILYRYSHDDGKVVVGGVPRGGVYELWTRTHRQNGAFGYPTGMPEITGNKTVCRFEGGTITSVAEKPRRVMFYNTALIGVDVDGVTRNSVAGRTVYTGRGRAAQLQGVIDAVSHSKADVVVLAEMMGNQERAQLVKAVKATFPHSAKGPDEPDGFLGLEEEDSGLLVVSRHPIKEVRTTIFRSCCGVDCLANKGAVMVRVSPSDGPEFCVVGTHLQNGNASDCSWPTDAGVGSGARGKREKQLGHLDSWILAVRDLDLPVIIVGDFNIDANEKDGRETLAKNLPDARDLLPEYQMWLPANMKPGNPVTSPKTSSYKAGTPRNSSLVRLEGSRIDLALLDQGERITAHVTKTGAWAYELEPGIDLSDHFAVTVDLGMSTVTHKLDRKARKTTAWLKHIHALELTDGAGVPHWSKKDPDNVDVSARIYKGKPLQASRPADEFPSLVPINLDPFGIGAGPGSAPRDPRPHARVEYDLREMKMGYRHDYDRNSAKTLTFNGSDDVHLEITIDEVDTAVGVEVSRTAIGRDRDVVAPKSSQLLHAYGGRRYAPNVMTGDGSEYVAIMHVNVDLEPFSHRREKDVP